MTSFVEGVGIIFLIACASFFLKKLRVLTRKDGEVLLTKILFYFGVPVLVFAQFSTVKFTPSFPSLFLSAIAVVLTMFFISSVVAKTLRLERKTAGSFRLGCQIMNTSMFAYALLYVTYGDEGLTRVLLFDFGNALMIYTLGYLVAVRYGDTGAVSLKEQLMKVFSLPALWAFILGIGANVSGFQTPEPFLSAIGLVKAAVLPLLLVALGLYFEPHLTRHLRALAAGILLRVIGGFIAGFVVATLLGLHGIDKTTVIISGMMPAGYNTLVYSAKEGMDNEFATSFISASAIVSMAFAVLVFPFL